MERMMTGGADAGTSALVRPLGDRRRMVDAGPVQAGALRDLETMLLTTMLETALPRSAGGAAKGAGAQHARSQLAAQLAQAITVRGGLGIGS